MMHRKAAGAIIGALTLVVVLAGCTGGADAPGTSPTVSSGQEQATPSASVRVSLDGDWKQTNGSEDAYQAASIAGDVISIDWVSNGGDTRSIYWIGSVEIPEGEASFTFVSTRDKAKTDSAVLASMDDTKTFTYADGELSYSASAFGTTTTVRMKKQ